MRVWVLVIAAVALVSCDSGTVPSPAERAQPGSSAPVVEVNEVVLRGEGLIAGAEAFYFAAGQKEVEASLARTLGKASQSGNMEECGAGPIYSSQFPGGLTVNFQNELLVGWFWTDAAKNISLTGDISIGAPRTEIEALDGFAMHDESTLGEEFSIGQRIGGFFEEDKLSILYAGTQCFFR